MVSVVGEQVLQLEAELFSHLLPALLADIFLDWFLLIVEPCLKTGDLLLSFGTTVCFIRNKIINFFNCKCFFIKTVNLIEVVRKFYEVAEPLIKYCEALHCFILFVLLAQCIQMG